MKAILKNQKTKFFRKCANLSIEENLSTLYKSCTYEVVCKNNSFMPDKISEITKGQIDNRTGCAADCHYYVSKIKNSKQKFFMLILRVTKLVWHGFKQLPKAAQTSIILVVFMILAFYFFPQKLQDLIFNILSFWRS